MNTLTKDDVSTAASNQVYDQVLNQVRSQVYDQVLNQVVDQVCSRVSVNVTDQIWLQSGYQIATLLSGHLNDHPHDAY
jgi:DNA-binding transcriptional regulator YhcF (GntR family)